jgi:hypothetical protein
MNNNGFELQNKFYWIFNAINLQIILAEMA